MKRSLIYSVCGLLTAGSLVLRVRESTRRPPFGTVVYGSARIWRGQRAAFSVATVADPSGQLVGQDAVLLRLQGGDGQTVLGSARSHPYATVHLEVPPELQPPVQLQVQIQRPEGEESLSLPLTLMDVPGVLAAERRPWEAQMTAAARRAAAPIAWYPDQGTLVGGLDNLVWGRISGATGRQNIACPSLGLRTESDPLGFFALHLLPPALVGEMAWSVGTPPRPSRWAPPVQPRQLTLGVQPAAQLAPGAPLTLTLRTLPMAGPIYVDLWAGDALLAAVHVPAAANAPQRWAMQPPPSYRGPVWLTAYRDPATPEATLASAVRWQGETADAWNYLASLPGESALSDEAKAAGPSALATALLPLALSRLRIQAPAAPRLAATVIARQAAFRAEQGRSRDRLDALMGLFLASAGGLALLDTLQLRRRRRRLLQQWAMTGENVDTLTSTVHAEVLRLERLGGLGPSLLLMMAAALVGAAWVLRQLSW